MGSQFSRTFIASRWLIAFGCAVAILCIPLTIGLGLINIFGNRQDDWLPTLLFQAPWVLNLYFAYIMGRSVKHPPQLRVDQAGLHLNAYGSAIDWPWETIESSEVRKAQRGGTYLRLSIKDPTEIRRRQFARIDYALSSEQIRDVDLIIKQQLSLPNSQSKMLN